MLIESHATVTSSYACDLAQVVLVAAGMASGQCETCEASTLISVRPLITSASQGSLFVSTRRVPRLRFVLPDKPLAVHSLETANDDDTIRAYRLG